MDTTELDKIPAIVRERISAALAELARIDEHRAGYRRLGMIDRVAEQLDADSAPYQAKVESFRQAIARKGMNADAVIRALQPSINSTMETR